MIQFNYTNLFKAKDPQITEEELKDTANLIAKYLENIKAKDQGFYEIVNEDPSGILEYAAQVKGQFDDIVILGIGGSALGNICLRDTLTHPFKASPRLRIIDNVDPYLIEKLDETLNYDRTLFIVISKSGGTPETLAQYMYFKEKTASENFVFITGKEGFLRETGEKENIKTFSVPENVGGRFSVLTAVGLLPAALIGIDIKNLLKGGQEMARKFLSEEFNTNLSFQFAAIQYLLNQKGVNINVMMPYTNRLKTFADWYSQLLAESIGKDEKGITPVAALGTTDQHSQVQLYNEGPRDKMIVFLEVENHESDIKIPNIEEDNEKINFLKDVQFARLINTEFQATQDAITNYGKANVTFKIDKVNAHSLGELFMLLEGATALLGEFFHIDAFNQPGVELGKELTKKYLEN